MTCARRSPGSSSPQPPRLAKWTVSEAAARTAASSASGDSGARGSSTISGRESASEISLRSISPAPRAKAGQWMREAGAPSRCGRRPSISVSAAAVSAARAWACSLSSPAGGRGDREDAREHEQLVGLAAGDHALGEPERVAQHERGRRQHAPAAAAEGDLDAHARAAAAGVEAHRLGQQRLVDPAGRQRQPAGAASIRMLSGCSSTTLRVSSWRCTLAPHAPAVIQIAAPAPSSSSAEPVT